MTKLVYSFSLFFLLLMIGCKKEKVAQNNTSNASAVVHNNEGDIKIVSSADNKAVASFSTDLSNVYVENKVYMLKDKGEKLKFFTNGELAYEIKFKDEGFKLKDASSKLLWKVKVAPDKIKISDNEEGQNPYEIKNDGGVITISKNDKSIHKVTISNTQIIVDNTVKYNINKDMSSHYGIAVMSIDEIPLTQRIFIAGELSQK